MKPKLQIIYYLATLINLAEASVLSLYFAHSMKVSFLIACLILVASISFSLCVMGLGFTFQSIEKISSPDAASYVREKGFIQIQWFHLLHSFLFCILCLYFGITQWIVMSLIKEILLWGIAFPYTRTKSSRKDLE